MLMLFMKIGNVNVHVSMLPSSSIYLIHLNQLHLVFTFHFGGTSLYHIVTGRGCIFLCGDGDCMWQCTWYIYSAWLYNGDDGPLYVCGSGST